jgi:hypothetical protein
MITPRPWLAPTPPLATPVVLCHGRLRIGGTGKPAGFHVPDVLCDTLGFLRLGGSIGHSRLVGQLAGVQDQKAYRGHVEAPVSVLPWYATDDTVPMPASRWLLPGPTRFGEP